MSRKRILLQYPGDLEKSLFDLNARDYCTEPFIRLRDELLLRGYTIEAPTRQNLTSAEWLLFWDIPSARNAAGIKGAVRRIRYGMSDSKRNWLRDAKRAGLQKIGVILWEPDAVCAANWRRSEYRDFSRVLTWDDSIVDGNRIQKMLFPIPEAWPRVAQIPFGEKKLLTNISANKHSLHPAELYSARREAVRFFERRFPKEFDLYGVGWDRASVPIGDARRFMLRRPRHEPPYVSYRGTIDHKSKVLPRYRFALCYENSGNQPGYITEKIFDVMRSGCVPVYLGAPNVREYIGESAFIDRREFSSNAELAEYLESMTEGEYAVRIEAIADYLSSERFKQFTSGPFVRRMISSLEL